MRFIHAADLHIDSPLSGLGSYEDAPIELFRTATRLAFSELVNKALRERVSFVILAGDIFDGAWKDWNTGMFFVRETARLREAGIHVIVKRGNHDAELDQTMSLPLPDNVHVFRSNAPETFSFEFTGGVKVALHGQSFARAAVVDNLASSYPPVIPGSINIGVLHTGLEGHTEHASYAPCSLEQLRLKDYQYWALGHIHQHQIYNETPWIVMPGNLQGRHIREPGARGAVLVNTEHGELQRPERFFVDVVRWDVVHVDISGCTTREEAVRRAAQAFEKAVEGAQGRPLACRVQLTGKSEAHAQIFGREQQLRAELTAQALAVARDALWIEKVKVQSAPAVDSTIIASRADALADLQTLFDQAKQDPDLMTTLQQEFELLLSKMPPDVFKQDVSALNAVKEGRLGELVAKVAPSLLDRIMQET